MAGMWRPPPELWSRICLLSRRLCLVVFNVCMLACARVLVRSRRSMLLRPGLVLFVRWREWSVVRLDPGRGPATSSRAARLGAGVVAGEECTEEDEYEEEYGEEDGEGRGHENER